MNRTNIKGSITVEAIVMLGLIATLTPILYKHVAERRQDIENINEANTLLLLKNATAEYIKANKDMLTTGTVVLTPADIGVDISGYRIGIRKDSDGTINAMIAASGGGNDMKAAKVAALLGLSAGIYSAQNLTKAWGINGVWAEDISNYGFTSLPTGIPVITTAYDKEDASGLNEEQLKEFIENTTFDKVTAQTITADEFCIKDECISSWEGATAKNLRIIEKCNNGGEDYEDACLTAWNNSPKLNNTCQAVATVYMLAGQMPPSEVMEYRLSKGVNNYVKETCYFPAGTNKGYTEDEIIHACYTENESRPCSLMGSEIEPICNDIKAAYVNLSKGAPASGNYTVYWDGAQTSYCDMAKTPAWTKVRDFTHGTTYTYNLPRPGKYRFEAYGGRSYGSAKGGYSWGIFTTETTPQFFIIVGSGKTSSGAGATEIRYGLDWRNIAANDSGTHPNNYLRDKYRIMVAGGAGGESRGYGNGGGGNNCGTGVSPGCKGVGGTPYNYSCNNPTAQAGGLGQTYMYGIGWQATYNASLNEGGDTYNAGNHTGGIAYGSGDVYGGFGGGGSQAGGGGGDNFGGGSGIYHFNDNGFCGGGGGGYGGSHHGGGGYGGGSGGPSIGSGGGGRVCLAAMPSGWPACSRNIFVFDEGGGTTGGNTTANGGTSDGNGIFRIWILEK